MDFEKRGKPLPQRREAGLVRGVDLVEHGEQPPLFVVIVKNKLGYIHR